MISTLAAVAALAAVCAADEEDSEGFSLQFDGWPSGENLGLSVSEFKGSFNVQLRFQLIDRNL